MPPNQKEKLRRLEFISSEEQHVNTAVAQLYVIANELGADIIKFQPDWEDEDAIERYLANIYVKLTAGVEVCVLALLTVFQHASFEVGEVVRPLDIST